MSVRELLVRIRRKLEEGRIKSKEAEQLALTERESNPARGINLSGQNRPVRNGLIPSYEGRDAKIGQIANPVEGINRQPALALLRRCNCLAVLVSTLPTPLRIRGRFERMQLSFRSSALSLLRLSFVFIPRRACQTRPDFGRSHTISWPSRLFSMSRHRDISLGARRWQQGQCASACILPRLGSGEVVGGSPNRARTSALVVLPLMRLFSTNSRDSLVVPVENDWDAQSQ